MRQVVLHPDEEAGWIAEVPSLPGCVSQGETREQALSNIRQAIDQWIDAAAALHRQVPPETFEVQVCVI
jgi:predicted RNase H-like HicB family nuclease